ncbi:MAG: hypothetical protein AAFZ09_13580, partial [Pseudomonadota bacterium]
MTGLVVEIAETALGKAAHPVGDIGRVAPAVIGVEVLLRQVGPALVDPVDLEQAVGAGGVAVVLDRALTQLASADDGPDRLVDAVAGLLDPSRRDGSFSLAGLLATPRLG